MKNNRRDNDLRRAFLYVQQAEERIAKQKRHIAELQLKRRDTVAANNLLRTMEMTKRAMENYLAVLLSLKKTD